MAGCSATAWSSPWTCGFHALRRFCERHQLEHFSWYLPYLEGFRSEQLRHLGDVVYVDYAGAALFSRSQLEAAQEMLLTSCLGNPHSSPASEEMVERTRDLVLHLFGTSRATHSVTFTSGTTQALQVLGEHYPWVKGGCFLYADESHTSVLGLRQFARQASWAFGSFALQDLAELAKDSEVARIIQGEVPEEADYNLLAFPGESNFTGLKADLSCVKALRSRWRILLDAAKLASSGLDLHACPADFVVVSFYKIFGYPTGLGCLICRHDAAPLLLPRGACNAHGQPLYFAGGTVQAASAQSDFVVPRPALWQWMERGTAHFQGILALRSQAESLERLGCTTRRARHALSVARDAFLRMKELRHSHGPRLCEIFGAHSQEDWELRQGPTLSLQLRYRDGSLVPYGVVAARAQQRKIMLRAGCHCNPGACQRYLGLSDEDVKRFHVMGKVCGDDRGLMDGRATGVVRFSFGLYSTLADVDRCVDLLLDFVDGMPEAAPEQSEELPKLAKVPRNLGQICSIKVYPVKGCGALQVRRWPLQQGSLFLDRRWCLTLGSRFRALSAKQAPRLTTVRMRLEGSKLLLSSTFHPETFELPLADEDCEVLRASGIPVEASQEATPGRQRARWFEELLGIEELYLVRAGDAGTGEAPGKSDFANAPATLLMVSTASLEKFGELCGLPQPGDRFRANLEVNIPEAFSEMAWPEGLQLQLSSSSSSSFQVAGRCVRCQAVDIDPHDASSTGPSLLAALATMEQRRAGPTFGLLLKHLAPRSALSAPSAQRTVLELGMSLRG